MSRYLSFVICLFVPSSGFPAEPPAPLAGLPSEPGPHIAKIKALGDNEWLNLGSPAADPKWGKARGRSWSSNMPAAPNLGGAFVFGEGVHAYVKPDGRYMNDIWFYDLNAHRWICLYPGIEVKTIAKRIKEGTLTVDERGLLVDKEGQPLPPLLIHAYGNLAYDPDRKELAFFGRQFGNYFTTGKGGVFEEANRLFQAQREGKKLPELSPFLYDAESGKLECFPVSSTVEGGGAYGPNVLLYIPDKKLFYFVGAKGVWYLDRKERTWVEVRTEGTPPTGIDHCAAYDPGRKRIYYQQRNGKSAEENFLIYDLGKRTWSKPRPKGTGPFYSSSFESVFNFDTANDRLVSIRLHARKDEPGWRRGVYAYDPETNTWADPLPLPPEVAKSIRNGSYGFYDPKLNVYFCHFAGDSRDDGVMWAYRFGNGQPD